MELETLKTATATTGIDFSDQNIADMVQGVSEYLQAYQELRGVTIENNVPPALQFSPLPNGFKLPQEHHPIQISSTTAPEMPENLDDLAFCTVLQLAELLKTGKVTSTDLTKMYLARLKKYNPILNCVVSITEELALAQAAQADAEISVGNYKGVLHGVPYGAKDLLAVKGYKTTWGAAP
jgi:hypothetical protein